MNWPANERFEYRNYPHDCRFSFRVAAGPLTWPALWAERRPHLSRAVLPLAGDLDGVCVVPREIEAEVLSRALKKARGERRVFEAIKGGMTAQASCDRAE